MWFQLSMPLVRSICTRTRGGGSSADGQQESGRRIGPNLTVFSGSLVQIAIRGGKLLWGLSWDPPRLICRQFQCKSAVVLTFIVVEVQLCRSKAE
jgi:hypothetical protein